jgi:type II secretion system protein G
MRKNQKGFTLIELLIVVAIIGIIAAIAIPNLLNALDRGKQKRTMSDMRSIGTAVESYQIDSNFYPTGTGDLTAASTAGQTLAPVYIRVLPEKDGWQSFFQYDSDTFEYTITSYGKGGAGGGGETCQGPPWPSLTSLFIDDICFVNGQFTQYPEGMQQ